VRETTARPRRGHVRSAWRVRRPRRVTKCEHTAVGTKNVRSSHGAATTMLRRPAWSASPVPSDLMRAHRGGYEERMELPGSSHDDITSTCVIAECGARAKQPNASTSRWHKAPREPDVSTFASVGRATHIRLGRLGRREVGDERRRPACWVRRGRLSRGRHREGVGMESDALRIVRRSPFSRGGGAFAAGDVRALVALG